MARFAVRISAKSLQIMNGQDKVNSRLGYHHSVRKPAKFHRIMARRMPDYCWNMFWQFHITSDESSEELL